MIQEYYLWTKYNTTILVLVGGIVVTGFFMFQLIQNQYFLSDGVIIENQDTMQEIDHTRQNLELRHRIASNIALSIPEVDSIVKNAESYSIDYHWLDSNVDLATIHLAGSISHSPLDGSFKNGYEIRVNERKEISVEIDRLSNEIKSVRIQDLPDANDIVSYTKSQQEIIDIVLSNQQVQDLIFGKDYYIVQVREHGVGLEGADCLPNGCALIGFGFVNENSGVLMSTILNPVTGQIHDIRTGDAWNR